MVLQLNLADCRCRMLTRLVVLLEYWLRHQTSVHLGMFTFQLPLNLRVAFSNLACPVLPTLAHTQHMTPASPVRGRSHRWSVSAELKERHPHECSACHSAHMRHLLAVASVGHAFDEVRVDTADWQPVMLPYPQEQIPPDEDGKRDGARDQHAAA